MYRRLIRLCNSHCDVKRFDNHPSITFSGNPKITLALVWTIILLWQETFKSSESTNSSLTFSTSLETPHVSKMERTLLDWCKQSVVLSGSAISESVQNPFSERISVHNFTSSFSDGLAFLYILKRYHPELIDDSLVIRMKQESSRKQLMEYTFQQYEKLGVPRLLDPEDFDSLTLDSNNKAASIDKKSVMTYVMCIFRKMHVPSNTSNDNITNREDHSNDKYLHSSLATNSGE